MDLLKALEWMAKQSVAASAPQLVEFDPTKCHASVKTDGSIVIHDGKPIWRKHKALDLATITNFAIRFKKDSPSIWYDRQAVVCLINDNDRRERVQFTLEYSPQLKQLFTLEKKEHIDQRSLIFMLRTIFKDCLGKHPNLIALLRTVKLTMAKDAEQDIGRGKSSLGAAIRTQMSAKEEVPEYVTLSIPIFNNGSLAFIWQDVECVVELLEDVGRFQLFPVPGKLETAIANAEMELRKTIEENFDKDIPIYYGTP